MSHILRKYKHLIIKREDTTNFISFKGLGFLSAADLRIHFYTKSKCNADDAATMTFRLNQFSHSDMNVCETADPLDCSHSAVSTSESEDTVFPRERRRRYYFLLTLSCDFYYGPDTMTTDSVTQTSGGTNIRESAYYRDEI